jgi:hypothetical protein
VERYVLLRLLWLILYNEALAWQAHLPNDEGSPLLVDEGSPLLVKASLESLSLVQSAAA